MKRLPLTEKLRHINEHFSISIPYKIFYSLIKSFGFTYKTLKYVLNERFSAETMVERLKIIENLSHKISRNYDLIFVDETSFTDDINFKKGWELKGRGIFVPTIKIFKINDSYSCD